MRVASLESVLTAATLVLAIVIVLWESRFSTVYEQGELASNRNLRQEEVRDKSITSAAAEAFSF